MDIPNRVTILISGNEYRIQVFDGEKQLSNRLMIMESDSRAMGSDEGDIFDDIADFEPLAVKIDHIGLGCFSIAGKLREIIEAGKLREIIDDE